MAHRTRPRESNGSRSGKSPPIARLPVNEVWVAVSELSRLRIAPPKLLPGIRLVVAPPRHNCH